jgi:hypothetical protein
MAEIRSIEGGKKNKPTSRSLELCECGCPWFKSESCDDNPKMQFQTCMMCHAEYTVFVEPCDG